MCICVYMWYIYTHTHTHTYIHTHTLFLSEFPYIQHFHHSEMYSMHLIWCKLLKIFCGNQKTIYNPRIRCKNKKLALDEMHGLLPWVVKLLSLQRQDPPTNTLHIPLTGTVCLPRSLHYPPSLLCIPVFPSHVFLVKNEFLHCQTAAVKQIQWV